LITVSLDYYFRIRPAERKAKQATYQTLNEAKRLFEQNRYDDALQTLRTVPESSRMTLDTYTYADSYNLEGISCAQIASTSEKKAAYLQDASTCFTKSLVLFTPDHYPLEHARAQLNLGATYSTLAEISNPTTNLNRAIDYGEQAIKYFTLGAFPLDYAKAEENIGTCYGQLAHVINSKDNLIKAVSYYNEARSVFKGINNAEQYAQVSMNLGSALSDLADYVDAQQYWCQAVDAYDQALIFYTYETNPDRYSDLKNNIGIGYVETAKYQNSISYLNECVDILTHNIDLIDKSKSPIRFAIAYKNLGIAYSYLSQMPGRNARTCLNRAVDCFLIASPILSNTKQTLEYARTKTNLADAYLKLALNAHNADYADEAISCLRFSLETFNRENYPVDYGRLEYELGEAYKALAALSHGRNDYIYSAIKAYELALAMFPKNDYPNYYCMVMKGLDGAKQVKR